MLVCVLSTSAPLDTGGVLVPLGKGLQFPVSLKCITEGLLFTDAGRIDSVSVT